MSVLLSFVIPCYRSEKTIERVVREVIDKVSEREEYDYEIITVNDCSPDNVYEVLRKLAAENPKIKVINFAKNMGKHAAILAGYAVVKGDYVINLDDDCQCPVDELWNLLEPLLKDESDFTTALYHEKKESLVKKFGSRVNLWMTEVMLDKKKGDRLDNFSAMKRFVADEIVKYKNPYPYLEGLILRVTNRGKMVEMEQRERGDDNISGYTLKKSLSLFVNGLTAFSIKPLRVAALSGVIFSIVGVLWGIYTVLRKIFMPEIPAGYSSMVAIMLFSSGLIMFMLGVIGEYVGRIYICLSDAPQYVIKETINLQKDDV